MSYRLLALLAIVSVGCGEARESPDDKQVTFQIINNSQFEIQDLYIQNEDQVFQDCPSLLDGPLGLGEVFTKVMGRQKVRVTVTRVLFDNGPLHAYTTAPLLDIVSDASLEYLDNQFRLTSSGSEAVPVGI